MSQLRKKTLLGVVWAYAQQFSGQIVNFVISIILARLLMPSEFGLIGMIAIVLGIGDTLKDAGMSESLIRTSKPDDVDYSSVFYINILLSVFIYSVIFVAAPLLSEFYGVSTLTKMTRVLSLGIIIGALSSVQRTKLTKEMNFKTQFFVDVPSFIISGIVGVVMAYKDYGVWSLVAMQLTRNSLSTLQLWFYSKWIPKLTFSTKRLKHHFNYGYKLTISRLLEVLYKNMYNILIGKNFTAADLGYYSRSLSTTNLVVQNITGAIDKVTFPLFSEIHYDNNRLKKVYCMVMQQVLFWIAPILIGAAVFGVPLFRLVFTEKWLPAVPMFQILCVVGIMYPIHSYNLSILNVKGRSDLFLKLEVIKKVIAVTFVFVVLPYGVFALLYFQVFFSIFAFFINSYFSGMLIGYRVFEQLKDIIPILIISISMGLLCLIVDEQLLKESFSDLARILIGFSVGVLYYFLVSTVFQLAPLKEFYKIITNKT